MSKKSRDTFDETASRAFLALLGLATMLLAGIGGYKTYPASPDWQIVFSIVFILGFGLSAVGLVCKKETVIKWADNSGNHEVLIPFVLAAFAIASLVKKRKL
jgi:hypothetical protein